MLKIHQIMLELFTLYTEFLTNKRDKYLAFSTWVYTFTLVFHPNEYHCNSFTYFQIDFKFH